MRWSWRIVDVAGIAVRVHATFAVLLVWVVASHVLEGHGLDAVVAGVGAMLALFGCVVLHELGHALVARRFGVVTRDITLLPIGGMARMDRIPEEPRQEFWIALAGPAVNVAIAAAAFAWIALAGGLAPLQASELFRGSFATSLLLVNVFLAAFNLIPAFPMDGGRVLRALLAKRTDYLSATRVAARIGQGIAILFGLLGLFTNPMLVFIAFFVWIGAEQEARSVRTRKVLTGVRARDVMLTRFEAVAPDDPLRRAVDLTLAAGQQDFPVQEGAELIGVLTRDGLLRGLTEKGAQARVRDHVLRGAPVLQAGDPVDEAWEAMRAVECPAAPVVERGRMVGLLTRENVAEYLRIREALEENGRAPRQLDATLRTDRKGALPSPP